MSSGISSDMMEILMKKLLGCKQLSDSVKTEDKQRVLDALIECAMTDIQLMRRAPGMDRVGLVPVMSDEEEAEFRKNLQRICT